MVRSKFIFLFLFLASCKYEDGPIFSLTSPLQRIGGTYKIEYVSEDGVDKTDEVANINYLYFGDEDQGSLFPFYYSFEAKVLNDPNSYISLWHFSGEDNTKIVAGTFGCGFYPATIVTSTPIPGFLSNGDCGDVCGPWTIVKLTANKMWLKTTFNNKNYEVHLKE